MGQSFLERYIFQDHIILINSWSKHCCIDKLLRPWWILLIHEIFDQHLFLFVFFFSFIVLANCYNTYIFLRNFYSCWLRFEQLNLEHYICFFIAIFFLIFIVLICFIYQFISKLWQVFIYKLNWYSYLSLTVNKCNLLKNWAIIIKFCCSVSSFKFCYMVSFNHAWYCSIRAITSCNNNFNFIWTFLHWDISIFESKSSRKIFIKNCNFTLCVLSTESITLFGVWIV
jgi:hypothetical protein